MGNQILIIDQDPRFQDFARGALSSAGLRQVTVQDDPQKALELLSQGQDVDVVLMELVFAGLDGLELLAGIKGLYPQCECLVVTTLRDAKTAQSCLRGGAYSYLVKPILAEDLVLATERALERKRLLHLVELGKQDQTPQLHHPEAFAAITTGSPGLQRVLVEAELHAESGIPVLITGESGVGKELLAQAIHQASPRKNRPFTAVNMAALTPTLFDAEFFGHTKGSFTGASRDRAGYLEVSHGGTLFLDEIGTLSSDLQGKLLRVLQEGEFFKIGSSHSQKADVRIIAATNADLEEMLASGQFRQDLYYRLKSAWLHLPPLRERPGDIDLLIDRFLEDMDAGPVSIAMDAQARALLVGADYPGNIRELRSVIQAALNLAQGQPITSQMLPRTFRQQAPAPALAPVSAQISAPVSAGPQATGLEPPLPLAQVERAHITRVYQATGRNKSKTARLLEISPNTLRRKLSAYGIE